MTQYTPNLRLSLYEGSDVPALDDQYNASMRILDEAVQAAQESSAGWEASVLQESQLRTQADIELQQDIDAIRQESSASAAEAKEIANQAKTTATNATTKANNAQNSANTAQATADAARTQADVALSVANSARSKAETAQEEIATKTTLKKGDKITYAANSAIIYGAHFVIGGKSVARFYIPTGKQLAEGTDKPTTATISGNALLLSASGGLINPNASGTGRPLSEYATWTGTIDANGILLVAQSSGTWITGGSAIPGTLGVIFYPTGNTTITLA